MTLSIVCSKKGSIHGGAIPTANELFDLSGDVALVTGASSGLGARFVEVLAANAARVALAARRTDRIRALAEKLQNSVTVTLDVTKTENFADVFDEAETANGPVSLLINNAGIPGDDDFVETGTVEWRHVQETNVELTMIGYVLHDSCARKPRGIGWLWRCSISTG